MQMKVRQHNRASHLAVSGAKVGGSEATKQKEDTLRENRKASQEKRMMSKYKGKIKTLNNSILIPLPFILAFTVYLFFVSCMWQFLVCAVISIMFFAASIAGWYALSTENTVLMKYYFVIMLFESLFTVFYVIASKIQEDRITSDLTYRWNTNYVPSYCPSFMDESL